MKLSLTKKLIICVIAAVVVLATATVILINCLQKDKTPPSTDDGACSHLLGEWEVTEEASCTKEGWMIRKCTKCQTTMSEKLVPLKPHSEGMWIVDKEPTMTEDGLHHTECTVCKVVVTEELMPSLSTNHTHTSASGAIEITKQPTCTEEGAWVKPCDQCGTNYESGVIEKIDHIEGDWIVDKAAEVGVAGSKHTECTMCEMTMNTEEIPALPEPEHQHEPGEWTVSKEASCTETGVEVQCCSSCGEELDRRELALEDHAESGWIVETPAKVGVAGKKIKKCTVCGEQLDEEEIPALSESAHQHVAGSWQTVKAPTCTETGTREKYCTTCGEKLSSETLSVAPHTESDWIVEKEASLGVAGKKIKKCSVCKKVTATETIPEIPLPSNTETTYENINYSGIYVPTVEALESGANYNWDPDDMTMDFSSAPVNVAKTENIKTSVLEEICDAGLGEFDRFLIPTGSFDLTGLPFVVGYNYSITIDYYTPTTQNSFISVINSGGNYQLNSASDYVFTAGRNTVTYNHTVVSGDSQFKIFTQGSLSNVYIAQIRIELSENGPTVSQMTQSGGYDWPISDLAIGEASAPRQISKLDESIKTAFTSAGYSESDSVLVAVGGYLDGFDRHPLFIPGYKYTVTIEYYAMGSGGHIIGMDSTYGNHSYTGGGAFQSGYHKQTYIWEIGKNGEYAVTFYEIPVLYIASFNISLEIPEGLGPDIYSAPDKFYDPSYSQVNAGYTFDFSNDNVPMLDSAQYINVGVLRENAQNYPELAAILTEDNGFADYAYYVNKQDIRFSFLSGQLISGKEYTITMRIYSSGSIGGMIFHGVNSGFSGSGDPGSTDNNLTVEAVAGLANVYDITAEVTPGPNTYSYITYRTSAEYYIMDLKIHAPGIYTEPTVSSTHPEYDFSGNNNAVAGTAQSTTLSELIANMSGSAFTTNMTASGSGLTDSANVGIKYEEFDDILYPVPKNSEFTKIYNVQDYGIDPSNTGEQNSDSFVIFAKELRTQSGLKKVYFPEGTYKFARTLVFDGLEDVYFCSERYDKYFDILMTEWVQAIILTDCTNIHFNNFTLDYEVPSTITGTVVSCDTSSKKVVIDVNDEFDLTQPEYNGGSKIVNGSYIEYMFSDVAGKNVPNPNGNLLYKNSMTGATYDASTGYLTISFSSLNSVSAGTVVSATFTMYEYFGIHMTNCEELYLEQANLYHTLGMAIGGSVCENVYFNGLRLSPNPKSSRLMTATADGFHPIQFKGEILITNSIFELSHDDSFNIKNAYQDLYAVQPKRIFYDPSVDLLVDPGDVIEVYRSRDLALVGSYKVVAVDETNACYVVESRITEDFSDAEGYQICNPSKAASFTLRNSLIGNKRNRGMLLQTRNMEISNCTMMNIIHTPVQILSVCDQFAEGLMPRYCTIKNTKFINNCGNDVITITWGTKGQISTGVIKDVYLENNFSYGQSGRPVAFSGAGNSHVKNNLFTYFSASSAVSLEYSSNVEISNNVTVAESEKPTSTIGSGNTSTSLSKPSIVYYDPMGPKKNEVFSSNGYSWDMANTVIGTSSAYRVGELSDAAKSAITAGGYSEKDFAVHVNKDGLLNHFASDYIYEAGNKYEMTITYYAESTGGYLIALDSTPGNHGFSGANAFEAGFHTKTYTWEVGANDEYALIFYQMPSVYILDMNLKAVN